MKEGDSISFIFLLNTLRKIPADVFRARQEREKNGKKTIPARIRVPHFRFITGWKDHEIKYESV